MGIKTAGALKALQYIKETTYGIVPAGQLLYGGKLQGLDAINNYDLTAYGSDGSRTTSIVTYGKRESGFKAELGIYRDSGAYSWTDLLELTLGEPSGIRGDIESFSTLVEASPDQYYLYRGCKVNSLSLAGTGVGAPVMASVDVLSMICDEPKATKAELMTNIDASIPALNPVTHNTYPICSLSGGITIPAMSYNITISNNLVQKEGIVNGKALKAGSLMYPGDLLGIQLEYTVPSTSLMWDRLKMSETSDFSVTQAIGGYNVIFGGCWMPGSDLPSRSQTDYDETLTVNASNMTWVMI